MGTTKKELFRTDQNQIANLAKVLGHPARIAIIQHIIKSENCINGDLVKELGLAQATISQHLKELKRSGIIIGSIEGASICYCIDEEKWIQSKNIFNDLFNEHITYEPNCC